MHNFFVRKELKYSLHEKSLLGSKRLLLYCKSFKNWNIIYISNTDFSELSTKQKTQNFKVQIILSLCIYVVLDLLFLKKVSPKNLDYICFSKHFVTTFFSFISLFDIIFPLKSHHTPSSSFVSSHQTSLQSHLSAVCLINCVQVSNTDFYIVLRRKARAVPSTIIAFWAWAMSNVL